jgi:hypothetical protein
MNDERECSVNQKMYDWNQRQTEIIFKIKFNVLKWKKWSFIFYIIYIVSKWWRICFNCSSLW